MSCVGMATKTEKSVSMEAFTNTGKLLLMRQLLS
jgi:hypothetical protein